VLKKALYICMNQNKKTSNEVLKKIAIKKLLYQRSNKRITKIKPLVLDLKKLKTDSLIYKKKNLTSLKSTRKSHQISSFECYCCCMFDDETEAIVVAVIPKKSCSDRNFLWVLLWMFRVSKISLWFLQRRLTLAAKLERSWLKIHTFLDLIINKWVL